MRKIFILTSVFFFLLSTLSFAEEKTTPDQKLIGIAAVVNHDIITNAQVEQHIDMIKKQLTSQSQTLPSDDELHKKVLDQLITQKLLLQQAKQKNITVSDEQLNDAINNIAKQNNIQLAQLKQAVEEQGLKFPEYKEKLRHELTLQAIQQQALRNKEIVVSTKEVNDYLTKNKPESPTKYHLQGILVSVAKDATSAQIETAKQKAEAILKRLKGGADFTQTASLESDGPQKMEGGDLGWHTLSAADTFFATQIITAKPDEIVGPLQTPDGFYIVKVLEIRADPLPPKDQLTAQVKNMLYQQKMMAAVEDWAKTLREHAYVKVMA